MMGIDWVTIGLMALSSVLTALVNRRGGSAAASPSVPQAPASSSAPASGAASKPGLFGQGGLLQRLVSGAQAQSATSPATTIALNTGHPLIDSLFHALENELAQNPQVITKISTAILSLIGPNGSTSVSVGAPPTPQIPSMAPVAVAPVASAPKIAA